jgi:hypothetical protein
MISQFAHGSWPFDNFADHPETVKKSRDILEDNTRHTGLKKLRAEVRRLQNRLSESNVQLRKVLNVILEADDKAANSPETACSLLHDVRLETAGLRESRDGAIPSVTVLSVEDFVTCKDDKDASSMLISLLHKLSSTSPESPSSRKPARRQMTSWLLLSRTTSFHVLLSTTWSTLR